MIAGESEPAGFNEIIGSLQRANDGATLFFRRHQEARD